MLDSPKEPQFAFMGVRELTKMFADGTTTPLAVLDAALAQIETHNDVINAFSLVDRKGARVAAEAATKRWRLGQQLSAIDGIPTTVKDVMMVKGWETTFGSRVLGPGVPSDWNSPAVDRLCEAGAVLIGQTITPEIGWKGVTDNTRHGTTRNPWNPATTPGGSSGGAGAAAAMGAGVLHLGTDGGGSIRIPSSFCGVFGHKPSHGRIPTYPPSPYSTLANIGPMTRRVEDAAIMLSILSRPDPRDWHALRYENIVFEDTLGTDVAGLRVAYSPDLGYAQVDPEVAECVRKATETFAALGVIVEEVTPPFRMPDGDLDTLWFAGIAHRIKGLDAKARGLLDPGLLELAKRGEQIALGDFIDATVARAEFGSQMKRFFQDYDLLLTPTVPMPAFDADARPPDQAGQGWSHDMIPFTAPFNLTKQPGCSIPCGFTQTGLPVGLQIVGGMFEDETVLRAAYAYEQAAPTRLFPIEMCN